LQKFSRIQEILDEAIKDMLNCLKTYKSQEYIVKDGQIGYKYQDDIDFDTTYGYNTMFAYFHENKNNKISDFALNKNLGIWIRLGSFSYAEIPLQNFNSIIGVTGTLAELVDEKAKKYESILTQKQNSIINDVYHIKNTTYMPSVYGRNNLKFEKTEDVLVEKEENHFKIICQEIKKKIRKEVAIFVVFETIQELNHFYGSNEFTEFKAQAKYVTEEANSSERKANISHATQASHITLFTRVFGRGTDFIVHDEKVTDNGGVHVIQTFLSDEYSEEVQIKGRTARQGNPGTYQLIISSKQLEKYPSASEGIQNEPLSNRYRFLDKIRREFYENQYSENIKQVDSINESHTKSIQFKNDLIQQNPDWNKIKSFLLCENKAAYGSQTLKTLILLDATGSMDNLLEKAKSTLVTMLKRINNVLDENNIKDKTFQIKIAAYRNYNSPEDKILQQSTWESKAHNLIKFLKSIHHRRRLMEMKLLRSLCLKLIEKKDFLKSSLLEMLLQILLMKFKLKEINKGLFGKILYYTKNLLITEQK
jgi:hypothetical protein